MAVFFVLLDFLAVFMYSEYCCVLRLNNCSSLTIRFCFLPVIGTVLDVPHDANTTIAVKRMILSDFMIIVF